MGPQLSHPTPYFRDFERVCETTFIALSEPTVAKPGVPRAGCIAYLLLMVFLMLLLRDIHPYQRWANLCCPGDWQTKGP